MIEVLKQADTSLFLFLNGCHSVFFDAFFWRVSQTSTWIPLYLLVAFIIIRHHRLQGLWVVLFAVALVAVTDQLSVHLFKNVFERLRPCHEPALEGLVHLVRNKCGGQFGFVSSHAANTFGFATFTTLFFRSRYYGFAIFFWALMVGYSRIYLGVHYPGDVVFGGLFGITCGYVFFLAKNLVIRKKSDIFPA